LDLEYRVMDDSGVPRWYHTRSRPVQNPDGGPAKRVAGATADITESRESAKALLNAEKLAAAGRLSATIAHEINNPLEAVMNLVFLAKSDVSISGESRKMLQQAEAELARTAHIARQNLGFYRDRAFPVRVDLRQLLIELMTIYSTHARRKNIQVEIDGDNLPIKVRAGDVRQAVSNVMLNAIDATPAGGHVKVLLSRRENGASIIIRDSGPGVPHELRDRVFEPFFTTKKDYGTGLGLWVTREVMRSCGGEVRLNESALGAEFELIVAEEKQEPPREISA
jgi:signal transduction histidine kinase